MEIVIVGAGLAGLAAAQRLVQAGMSVTVVEARDRLGGRVWTLANAGGSPIELGAEWIGASGVAHDLLSQNGVPLDEAHGNHWLRIDGRWQNMIDLPHRTNEFLDRVKATTPAGGPDRSLAAAVDRCCKATALDDARSLFLAYVEGFHAADPAHLSVHWLAEVEANQPAEASELRSCGGAGRLVEVLAAELKGKCTIRLGNAAREVRWRPGAVEIAMRDGSETVRADAAIVTVPLPMLKAIPSDPSALRFTPALEEQLAAARQLEMGQVVKLVLRFREAFWRETRPLNDMLFLHLLDQPFPTWWAPADARAPLLTAWAGGPQALRLAGADERTRIDLALRSLGHAFDMTPRDLTQRLEAHYIHDWHSDPYAMGAYTYVAVGGIDAHETLARPAGKTIYLAGEATCGAGLNATMEGALQSGQRAADAVLRARDGT